MGRKNRQQRKQAQTQKTGYLPYNIYGGDVLPYLHAVPTNYDWDGEFGRTQAFKYIGTINRCVSLIADAAHSMPWQIVRGKGKEKEVIATSEDRNPTHPLAKAIQNVFKRQGQPLFSLMTYSTLINGETYLEKVIDGIGFRRIKWLNPLATEPLVIAGCIEGYRYFPINGGEYARLTAEQVAYYHTFSGDDDLRGHSRVEAAMREINLDRSVYSYVKNTLWNNARPGLILAPASDANSGISGMFTPQDTQALERQATDFHKGTHNAHNTLISPRPLNATVIESPDIDRYYSILDPNTRKIAVVFGTPLAMLGDSNASTYKDGKDVRDSFYINTIIPHCRLIGDFMNIDVMPDYAEDPEDTFEFDTTEFEDTSDAALAEMNVNNGRLQSGYITMADAARAQGLDPAPQLEGLVMIEGTPVPLSEVGNLWKIKWATPAPQFGFGQSEPDTSRLEIRDPDTIQLPSRTEYVFEKPLPVEEWRRKALAELVAWQKHEKAGKTRNWEPVHVAHILEDWQSQRSHDPIQERIQKPIDNFFDYAFAAVRYEPFKATLARIDHVFDPITRKDIGETRQEFEDEFLLAIADAKEGTLSKAQLRSLLHTVIRTLGEQAYRDGLEDGGVKDAELSDEDLAEIARIRRTSEGYANDFVKEFDTYSEAQLDQRPKMWVNKTLQDFYFAGLASADANGVYVWVEGDTIEKCNTCLGMEGQRARMKTWIKNGILPKSERLECKGFHCECELLPVRGRARGQ